jgi:hypothetical protein
MEARRPDIHATGEKNRKIKAAPRAHTSGADAFLNAFIVGEALHPCYLHQIAHALPDILPGVGLTKESCHTPKFT